MAAVMAKIRYGWAKIRGAYRLSRRNIARIVAAMVLCMGASAKAYDANWESLNARPCPQWWKDAKFGIFIHWGVYSVPAFAPCGKDSVYDCYAEHYANPKRWKDGSETVAYHAKRYPNKSYNDFAADFKAENFDPSAWADLFRRAGAKYVVLTSKHHDGFALWPSAQSPHFNAADVAQARLATICRARFPASGGRLALSVASLLQGGRGGAAQPHKIEKAGGSVA